MFKTLLLAATVAVVTPQVADACLNGTEWTTNDYVRVVMKAEKQVEAGDLGVAKKTLGQMRFPTAALQERATLLKTVIKLRTSKDPKDLEAARAYFQARSEAKDGAKDLRFRAWLAEAQVATGMKDEARAILVALKEQDLMPDAYAYASLAKLSTGAERYELYKACRTRAKNKMICELPVEVKSSAQAAR